jgi:integrase
MAVFVGWPTSPPDRKKHPTFEVADRSPTAVNTNQQVNDRRSKKMHPNKKPYSRQRPAGLTTTEVRRLLRRIQSVRMRAIIMLAYLFRLHLSEIARLRWDDVDLGNGSLETTDGKTGRRRVVTLPPVLAAELRDWFGEQEAASRTNRRLAAALAAPESAYVFPTSRGTKSSTSQLAHTIKVATWRATGSPVPFHRLALGSLTAEWRQIVRRGHRRGL